jgi:uncharacterized protein YjeT (DUF2065 family)
MADFIVALGLVFVIEGLIFAAKPAAAKNAHGARAGNADGPLRVVGIASAVLGVVLVWLVRGSRTRRGSRGPRRAGTPSRRVSADRRPAAFPPHPPA